MIPHFLQQQKEEEEQQRKSIHLEPSDRDDQEERYNSSSSLLSKSSGPTTKEQPKSPQHVSSSYNPLDLTTTRNSLEAIGFISQDHSIDDANQKQLQQQIVNIELEVLQKESPIATWSTTRSKTITVSYLGFAFCVLFVSWFLMQVDLSPIMIISYSNRIYNWYFVLSILSTFRHSSPRCSPGLGLRVYR